MTIQQTSSVHAEAQVVAYYIMSTEHEYTLYNL